MRSCSSLKKRQHWNTTLQHSYIVGWVCNPNITTTNWSTLLLPQYTTKVTQSELSNTNVTCDEIRRLYTMNNSRQDSKKQNQKTYRFKKIKFPKLRPGITNNPRHGLNSQHRTKTVPEPYRNTKKHNLRYGFKDEKNQ